MAALPLARRPLTLEDYVRVERETGLRHEFYDGEVFAMAGGTGPHSALCVNVTRHLGNALDGTDCVVYNEALRVRCPATAPGERELDTYPDASVVCGEPEFAEPADTLLNPVLLVEVLSDSTEAYDRTTKFRLYGRIASLREYVLVAQDRRSVEVFRRGEGGAWTYLAPDPEVDDVGLASVGATLTFEQIYAKVGVTTGPLRPPGAPARGAEG